MKKINFFLLFSLILMAIGYRGFREFNLLRRGNKLSITKKHIEADTTFREAVTRYNSETAESNAIVNLYEGMLYRELLDTTNGNNFHRGNSEVYLGEKEQSPESQIAAYRKALEEYKAAMKVSDDINIKKNYEIIAMRIEQIEKQQQQNQENQNQEKKDNQEKSKDGKDNKESDQQSDRNKDQDSQQSEQDDNKKQDQTEKNNDQDEQQNNEDNQGNTETKKDEKSTVIKEALATLEKLENSEEQAFKNNERLEYLGGDTDESW